MSIIDIKRDEYIGMVGMAKLDNWDCDSKVAFSEGRLEYAEKCVKYIQEMDSTMMQRLLKYAHRYYKDMVNELGDDFSEIMDMDDDVSEDNIINYICPSMIIIEDNCREDRIEFHVECGCDWEPEHGLEFTISDNKILYVGGFDDMPPYNEGRLKYVGFYSEDNNMNYADKE